MISRNIIERGLFTYLDFHRLNALRVERARRQTEVSELYMACRVDKEVLRVHGVRRGTTCLHDKRTSGFKSR